MRLFCIIVLGFFAVSMVQCVEDDNTIPKPLGYFRIDFPAHEYETFASYDCPFTFETPKSAVLMDKSNAPSPCYKYLYYPKLKATVYFTYFTIDSNFSEITKFTDEKVYSHHEMASGIMPKEFINVEEKVFGTSYSLMGNTAVNYLFYVTDSTNHYFAGQLYFETVPNYDSLQPCIQYIEEDMQHLIETFKWK
jgi:gliding motility-associated lipoprotein GldD